MSLLISLITLLASITIYSTIITTSIFYEDHSFINALPTGNKSRSSTVVYGCEVTGDEAIHCSQLHNKLESFAIKSKSTIIYNATDSPMFVRGKEQSALQMYANHLKSITFSNTSTTQPKQFSIALWIKGVPLPDKPNAPTVGHIISQFNGAHTAGWSIDSVTPYKLNLKNETTHVTIYNSKGEAFSSPDVPIFNNNTFTHVVATFNGSLIKVYKDGNLFGETKFNGTYNNKIRIPLTLGVSSSDPMFFYWTGNIDDLRYYNKLISGDEVKAIFYDQKSTENKHNKNLIGHWRFNGNLDDASGNGHNGSERTLISSMVFAPDGRLFFSEKDTGKIRIMENGRVTPQPFATIDDHHSNWEQGLLGLALDPDFKYNHFLYQFYTSVDNETKLPFNRIVRFTDAKGQGTNETIILDRIPASNGLHSGGAMAFGPDNKLYVTIGDATQNIRCGNLPNSTGKICPAQNQTSLLGKVLRINRDGSIPKDNPYPGSPVFNIGHRNMYGIAFDDHGFGLVSENGAKLYDEVNTVEKGKNYGSPTLQPINTDPEMWPNYTKPLRSYYNSYCLTQMIFYNGNKLPQLKDKFLLAALGGSNTIYAFDVDTTNKKIIGEEAISLHNFPNNQVVTMAQSPNGDLYYGAYAISKLDSLDTNRSAIKQYLFPIEITYSPNDIDIKDLFFIPSENKITIDLKSKSSADVNIMNNNDTNNTLIPSNTHLLINLPKKLLSEITNITAKSKKVYGQISNQNVDFRAQNLSSDRIRLDILPKLTGNYRLSINGKSSYDSYS